jgi:serine/threonine-protein kinase
MVLEGFRVKVMDFGIAHFESSNMTQTGVAMGTPNYISPEQLSGKEVTKSSDIFSLGVVMYEMLAGQRPFEGENLNNLIVKILNNEPDRPSKIDSKVPPLLDHVVMRALEKDPLKRFQSATEMEKSLRDFISSFAPKTVRY